MKKLFYYAPVVALVLIMAACGGDQKPATETTEAPATTEAAPAEVSPTISLVIEANDMMKFNTDELKVTEGQVVTLTLKHVGTMPKEAMGHNWVLLANSTDPATFGAAAIPARETNYIPESLKEHVIANTTIVGGGEEVTITFDAPKAGYYKYICSFPGHYGVMQGTFVVQPK